MVWSLKNSKNDEASKIRWNLIPYMQGFSLDVGCGAYKVFPKFTGVDNGHHWGTQQEAIHVETAEKLTPIASQSVDCLFSSHLLEHLKDWKGALREWWRVLKPGGYLCLYLPHADFYPNCDEKSQREWDAWWKANSKNFQYRELAVDAFVAERIKNGANTIGKQYAGTPYFNGDHKRDFYPHDIISEMEGIGGWDLVENEERNEADEYSFWQVYKKLPSKRDILHSWFKDPEAPKQKTCAVVRYGAIGDMIQASSIFPWLREQGYHVTLYCQAGQGYETIQHDPNIDRFIIQEKDAVPPPFLLEFFTETKKKYDLWINLCESVEGTLLAAPKRANWDWPNEARKIHMDRNYLEWTHQLAGVPAPYKPKFYSTTEEKSWALKQKGNFGKRNILWSLAGSSGHKSWPHLDDVMLRILPCYPDVHIVLVGDESCKILEQGWCKWDEGKNDFVETNTRVHLRSGKWTIRQSMAFAEAADLIIGVETGLLNAAGSMDTAKIITMSHSSDEMLTKHWKRTITLHQPGGVGCPKHPCRQLHGSGNTDPWIDCPQHVETGTAVCQHSISPDQMWEAIQKVLGEAPALVRRAA